jgi:hypothetical protein
MKSLITFAAVLCTTLSFGQTSHTKAPSAFEPVPSLPVKGSINIAYRTRSQSDGDKPKAGVTDVYTLNINVANSALFKGTISHLPYIHNTVTPDQQGKITYELDLDVVNPARPEQTRNVGKMFGSAPIDKMNIFRYSDGGGVKVAVFPIGAAKGFESRFNGLALAKPPASSGIARLKQEAVRLVSSKGGAIVLTKYDKMSFEQHVLPAGPVQIYPETTVTGILFYDYGRSAWHFNNVTLLYNAEGRRAVDTLTGSIRWIEAPNRKSTGEGHYEFNINLNEPPPTESAVFGAVADESSFFASDEAIPSLTGAINYKDTITPDGTVTASVVQIDLKGNKLSKQQVMALSKLLFLSALVPINAE